MILSFHPCFEADKNIICAGRQPGPGDLAAVKTSEAVILPQGCYESLYEMARNNCPNVFPNFDVRFKYPGKIGQTQLFQEINTNYPKTEIFLDVKSFHKHYEKSSGKVPFGFRFVFKFNQGGEGSNVYLIKSYAELQDVLKLAENYEKTGQTGFLIQEYIPSQNRALRVVVIGQKIMSYWRIQKSKEIFCSSLAKGAVIDRDSDPFLQETAAKAVKNFCDKTGINLAGFDLLFSTEPEINEPLFLEINYFFGRKGLGGSEKFYELLIAEIKRWLRGLGLS